MDNQIKGYKYEKFINNFLNTKDDVKISYLWKDIPDLNIFYLIIILLNLMMIID